MKQALEKLQSLFKYHEVTPHITGKQQGGKRTIEVFAQSALFDFKVTINGEYASIQINERFNHIRLVNTAVNLCDMDYTLKVINKIIEEHTVTTL